MKKQEKLTKVLNFLTECYLNKGPFAATVIAKKHGLNDTFVVCSINAQLLKRAGRRTKWNPDVKVRPNVQTASGIIDLVNKYYINSSQRSINKKAALDDKQEITVSPTIIDDHTTLLLVNKIESLEAKIDNLFELIKYANSYLENVAMKTKPVKKKRTFWGSWF